MQHSMMQQRVQDVIFMGDVSFWGRQQLIHDFTEEGDISTGIFQDAGDQIDSGT
jgi:hypothetical protein